MISLTPIPNRIQKRLFEKMKVLGRTSTYPNNSSNGVLTHDKMATRSTFLRMTSGQLNPVVLMGGKLKDTGFLGTMTSGYDDVYGPRVYAKQSKGLAESEGIKYMEGVASQFDDLTDTEISRFDQVGLTDYKTVNSNKRPLPGVKSIDVSFKGGVKALREATISWTCWDWAELDELMPHFLAHGKTVMVEWGWVYDNTTLQDLPNFIKVDVLGNRYISADAYNNYRNKVINADGDFDLMVGVIKNFEYTTREDGGFDCQTILSSVGVSIINNIEPNKSIISPSTIYDISSNEKPEDVKAKIEAATGEESPTDNLIKLNTSITFKAFLSEIDTYISNEVYRKYGSNKSDYKYTGTSLLATKDGGTGYIYYAPNKFILDIPFSIEDSATPFLEGTFIKNAWVRWGWFEDNILSKFLSVTSEDGENPIITEFRSVERVLTSDGQETDSYESSVIRNNERLETVNINSYILPGQFFPLEKRIIKDDEGEVLTTLDGDSDELIKLYNITKDRENFEPFATKFITIPRDNSVVIEEAAAEVNWDVGEKAPEIPETELIPGKFGYLRNMLINTKVIKAAFGVDAENDTIEAKDIFEGIQELFNMLNQELNFWKFDLTVDETDTNRIKIVDTSTTNVDFNKPITEQRSKVLDNGEVFTIDNQGNRGNEGVFYFPVWRHNSLVKRQNVTAKIPSSMQLAAMYGSNVDAVKGFGDHQGGYPPAGVIAGALTNDVTDKNKSGLDIAIKNFTSQGIGQRDGDSTKPITINGGDDSVLKFLKNDSIIKSLETTYDFKRKKVDDEIENANLSSQLSSDDYDPSLPPPMPRFMEPDEWNVLFNKDSDLYDRDGVDDPEKNITIDEFKKTFGQKFIDGKMKNVEGEDFLKNVKRSISAYGASNEEGLPVIIPLELEIDIDGIGGIYPANSFHSEYLPNRYKTETVFQTMDVDHRLDSSGWTTTLRGMMRSTLGRTFSKSISPSKKDLFENYKRKVKPKKDTWNVKYGNTTPIQQENPVKEYESNVLKATKTGTTDYRSSGQGMKN